MSISRPVLNYGQNGTIPRVTVIQPLYCTHAHTHTHKPIPQPGIKCQNQFGHWPMFQMFLCFFPCHYSLSVAMAVVPRYHDNWLFIDCCTMMPHGVHCLSWSNCCHYLIVVQLYLLWISYCTTCRQEPRAEILDKWVCLCNHNNNNSSSNSSSSKISNSGSKYTSNNSGGCGDSSSSSSRSSNGSAMIMNNV